MPDSYKVGSLSDQTWFPKTASSWSMAQVIEESSTKVTWQGDRREEQ